MIETGKELADAAKKVAEDHKTLYVLGCFGWPMTEQNKARAMGDYSYNRTVTRESMIRQADQNTFAFDCSNLIKGLLWGWNGDQQHQYGGAVYRANNVPDLNADTIFSVCNGVSSDFSNILVGEALWMKGHIGIYIGDGLAVECTPKWKNGVQITAVHNIGEQTGYNGRKWTSHGRLPYVRYEDSGFQIRLHLVRKGMKGDDVKALQGLLIAWGCGCGKSGADGIFGENTEKALKAFQTLQQLEIDGIAGPNTFAALLGVMK